MYLGGLDIGTTGCKLSVYDFKGNFVFNSYKEYEVSRLNGEHEIDAEIIFSSVCEVIRDVTSRYEMASIGVTTFGETFVLVDENDTVLFPSMLYTDPRGEKECESLSCLLSENKLIKITGVKPHQMYSLPKIIWLKNNYPDIFAKIKRIMLIEDYIVYKLTGNAYIDYSLAARTMAFDIKNKCWSDEILKASGVDKSLFSTPVPAGNIAGEMKNALKTKFGIKNDIKIINGSHDQVAAAVGAGIFNVGETIDGTGTVECVTPVFDKIPENDSLYNEGYSVVPYVFDGTYVCYALSFTGGAVLKWYRDNFSKETEYFELDKKTKNEPTGILVMPHFAGAANPYMDNGSKAAVLGLTLEHNDSDFYKALMEGVTYEIMLNIEHLEDSGIKPKILCATGGGAYSNVWLQIKADILNRTVIAIEAKEAGACGTCMLSGVALGIYKDLEEAKKYFVKFKKCFTPNPENVKIYSRYYNVYKKIYGSVRPLIEEMKL